MSYPLVSIVMTSYNRANWIGQAIESALAQDYPNFELVVSDNCSTDGSEEVIKHYTHDQRVRYSKNEKNIGMMPNFQKVFFELAKGDYITHLSNDDYLSNPRFISKAVSLFQKYPTMSVIFGMHNQFNDVTGKVQPNPLPNYYQKEIRKGKDVFMDFADAPYLSMGGAVYNSKFMKEYNMAFSGGATGDIELNLQSMLHGDVGFINENVYMTRVHATNASGIIGGAAEIEKMYLEVYNYIYKKAADVIEKPLLDIWYQKLIRKNILLCLNSVVPFRNRKQTMKLNSILIQKYRALYLKLLVTHPKYVARMILNR
jgi:glycosyltransferase involved in cell wall biosynthesis